MRNTLIKLNGMLLWIVMFLVATVSSCSDDDDNRVFEEARIVGVKINNELFTPAAVNEEGTIVNVPAGMDLSNSKLQILVANGELVNFVNEVEYDCRKPIPVVIKGYNGTTIQTNLCIKSAPKLLSFVIKGLSIPTEDIHESATRLIVQVPKNTNLKELEVTMEFANGELQDFQNGVVRDYTNPCNFTLLGVDGKTKYSYELVITTEQVGPATISAIVINGVESDSIVTVDDNVLIPYIPQLMNFTVADVELKVGFGNTIDDSFTGKGLNLMTGDNVVSVTGSNGVPTEFVIGVPKLSLKPLFVKSYSELGFAANDLTAVGFSGEYLLAGNYTSEAKSPIYYTFDGDLVGQLSVEGVDPTGFGFRKFATDEKGKILALSLGMSDGEQWIYKWDNVKGKGSEYISFSKVSLGVDYAPRAAGINISGSLDGNATIMLTIAEKTDIFIWTVSDGVLNPTPQKYSFPYEGASYYWSICAVPDGKKGYIGFVTNSDLENAGIVCLDEMMSKTLSVNGISVTDGKTISFNGRDYLAYVSHNDYKGTMCICDITDGQQTSYANPIFKQVMEVSGDNGNATMDADMVVLDGKLYVAFACTNLGLYLYEIK